MPATTPKNFALYEEASLSQRVFPPDLDGNARPDVFEAFLLASHDYTCGFCHWPHSPGR